MKKREIMERIAAAKARSAWQKGVIAYAEMIVAGFDDNDDITTEKDLLGGAHDWHSYSWGGSAFCYDKDIAETLCTPYELKITRHGERRPNAREEWLDTQARALCQAARLILGIVNNGVVLS